MCRWAFHDTEDGVRLINHRPVAVRWGSGSGIDLIMLYALRFWFILGCILPPKKRTSELSSLAATLRHMSDFVLQGAILERCVRNEWRPGFRPQLCPPGQLPTGSRITSLRSIPCLCQRLRRLLWAAVECRGRRTDGVCSSGLSYQPVPVYHIPQLTILYSMLGSYSSIRAI